MQVKLLLTFKKMKYEYLFCLCLIKLMLSRKASISNRFLLTLKNFPIFLMTSQTVRLTTFSNFWHFQHCLKYTYDIICHVILKTGKYIKIECIGILNSKTKIKNLLLLRSNCVFKSTHFFGKPFTVDESK